MAAILLFILAGITLVVTCWNFLKKPPPRKDEDDRSDYLKAAVDKLRDNVKPKQNIWRWLFQTDRERRRDYLRRGGCSPKAARLGWYSALVRVPTNQLFKILPANLL